MDRRILRVLFVALAFATVASFYPRQADAVVIYHSGEDFFETGEIPEEFKDDTQLAQGKAGYVCQVFGLFWAYFHWWDCEPGILDGDILYTDPAIQEAVAKKYSFESVKMGFWQKNGRWVIGGVLLLLIIMGILRKGKKSA